jgi:hypothetical protein
MPQFAQPTSQLQTQFQSLLDNPKIRTPKVPWTLSKQEKKDYDQIFRAWDVSGEGFISGEMAREVFGQSGLGQNDLIKVWYVTLIRWRELKERNFSGGRWISNKERCPRFDAKGRGSTGQWLTSRNLADVHNRGKLNLPEFHVAMGLIYRGELTAHHLSSKIP